MAINAEVAMKVHAELQRTIQEHEGKITEKSFDPGLYMTRSAGQVYADAAIFTQIIKLTAEFGAPAAVVSFLIYARPILLKWLELKNGRSIEIRKGDIVVKIHGNNDLEQALETFERLNADSKEDAKN